MLDLNDLRVFERVASLRSFSAAALQLDLPKSSVSRSVARLERELGVRLLQRTTRDVGLTGTGTALHERCVAMMSTLDDTVDIMAGLAGEPRGRLSISSGVGFGVNVLSDLLPGFVRRHPRIHVELDLTARMADLISDGVDVAIRLGPMADSDLVAMRLGAMRRYLCAAPAYLERCGTPEAPEDLARHDTVGIPSARTSWRFERDGEVREVGLDLRIGVNEALTVFRLVRNGAGVGVVSGYMCGPEIVAGRLVRLLPDWTMPPLEVSLVFPSRRELAPVVRAFADYIREATSPGRSWLDDPLTRPD